MKIVSEALAYFAVSACALLIDISLLFILVHFLSWWYVAAATASFLVGLLVIYGLSVTLVFKYRRLEDPRIEFATFACIGIIGVAINASVISFGTTILGLHYLLAKCGAAAFTYIWNFVARRQLLFVQRHSA
jgi:putative flippase GtrA